MLRNAVVGDLDGLDGEGVAEMADAGQERLQGAFGGPVLLPDGRHVLDQDEVRLQSFDEGLFGSWC